MSKSCPSCGRKQEHPSHIACNVCKKIYVSDNQGSIKRLGVQISAVLSLVVLGAVVLYLVGKHGGR